MNIKAFGLAAALLFGFAGAASAATVLDTTLNSGWHNGTGTVDGHFTVERDNLTGLELGLRAAIRFVGPITPTGNVYTAPIGSGTAPALALWNFEYSFDPGQLRRHHHVADGFRQSRPYAEF